MNTAIATTENMTKNLRHPAGLYILFFTEMWERFSYYGMRSLLVYYMIKHLQFTQERSSEIYGLYTGFVFFTPFFGGMLADRLLGQHRSVILGGVLMAIGHFLMAFERLFFPALIFLILGNGAFKPNISTQVGALYPAGDHRRDRAFSIFYMGINLGAFFSPLVCGTLGEKIGFHWGFGAAGVGMVIGLFVYLWGQKYLAPDLIMQKKGAKQQNVFRTDDARGLAEDRRDFRHDGPEHRFLERLRAAGQHDGALGRRQYGPDDLRLGDAGLVVSIFQSAHDLHFCSTAEYFLGLAGSPRKRTFEYRKDGNRLHPACRSFPDPDSAGSGTGS